MYVWVCEKNTACSRIYRKSAVQTSTHTTAIKHTEANDCDILVSHQIRFRLRNSHPSSRITYNPYKCLTCVEIQLLSTEIVPEV